jgi:predicted membrane protein
MKKVFYLGLLLLLLFELANVWFIMPMPYSQRVRSIEIAYALHSYRWFFRVAFGAMVVVGALPAMRVSRWQKVFAPLAVVTVGVVVYATNFIMAADQMFLAPKSVVMRPAEHNAVDPARLVVGIEIDGQARAYPVQFIGYHHQVRDTVNGTSIMVSFCTVCRTGRVFRPTVGGKVEDFRLVGMDHFNAMFEDRTTGSWWRQANGEAIAGPLKGQVLEEIESQQMTLARWLAMHPSSLVMQPDSALATRYSRSFDYETGRSRASLTGTDTISWGDKAWIVGITQNGESVAFDWNRLKRDRVINEVVGGTPVVLALASDTASFVAYARPDSASRFTVRNDSLVGAGSVYDFSGRSRVARLTQVKASQEFWHSWQTFQPNTRKHGG